MYLKIVSDIHQEYRKKLYHLRPCPRPNIAILAGDICEPFSIRYESFLMSTRLNFDHVLLVAGNHEYYTKRSIAEVDNYLDRICNLNDCVYLNRKVYSISHNKRNYNFMGCTLWSCINKYDEREALLKLDVFERMGISIPEFNNLHSIDVEWVSQQIKHYDNLIAITHYAPLFSMALARRGISNPIGFGTDLDNLVRSPIKIWISGHTHNCKRIIHNRTICISNCLGYPGEETGFDDDLYFELE